MIEIEKTSYKNDLEQDEEEGGRRVSPGSEYECKDEDGWSV